VLPSSTRERTDGSHSPATAAQRERWAANFRWVYDVV
jgi:hypothetical protein